MTSTTTNKPRAARRRRKTTPKPMTSESYQVKENEVEIPKVILPKPEDDIIPLSSYIKDAQNRWKIHQYEIKELSKDIRWGYNKAKPYIDKVVARFSPKGS